MSICPWVNRPPFALASQASHTVVAIGRPLLKAKIRCVRTSSSDVPRLLVIHDLEYLVKFAGQIGTTEHSEIQVIATISVLILVPHN